MMQFNLSGVTVPPNNVPKREEMVTVGVETGGVLMCVF